MKRTRHPSSSEDSDNGSSSTSWSQHSKSHPRRVKGKKASEVFRTDLITAMKVHDSHQLNLEEFYVLADPWRQEWEKGVQVPVSPESIPQPVARVIADKGKEVLFTKPKKLIRTSGSEALGYVDIVTLANGMCRYDLNEEDVAWLQLVNAEFCEMGMPALDEMTMERVMEEFERRCHDNMSHAMETEEGLGIEYDEDVVCDVCLSPDGEDNNEMVFCDKCNICVHQACYGIQKVPEGSWLCRICALGIVPKCQLCPKKGGAMKPTRSGTKWVHVSCALWIPEVSIGNPEKMEPITNVSHIPSNRWALICCLCKEKTGACIQCSAKNCRVAFHVTCGLQRGLDMSTVLTEEDEVKFKSYCPKHSGLEGGGEGRDPDGEEEEEEGEEEEEEEEEGGGTDKRSRRKGRIRGDAADKVLLATPPAAAAAGPPREPEGLQEQQEEKKRVNLRTLKLQQLEEEFYRFVDAGAVAAQLNVPGEAVDFLFQYWKLRRRAGFNQPLLTPKKDEEESLARREKEVLRRRLELFTHLRQDLERVRNLTYMVTRREKMKRSLWRVQEQTFHQQVRLLEQELQAGEVSTKSAKVVSSLSLGVAGRGGTATKRGSLKKDRKKGRVPRTNATPAVAAGNAPANHGAAEAPKGPPEVEDGKTAVGHARLEPKVEEEEVSVVLTRLKPEEGRGGGGVVGRAAAGAGLFPDLLQQRRVSVVLTRLKPGNDPSYAEERTRRSGTETTTTNPPAAAAKTKTRPGTSGAEEDGVTAATAARPNGWLRKAPCAQANGSLSSAAAAGGHLKNWGKFRIPKRTGRPLEAREQGVVATVAQQRKPLLRPLTNTSEPSYPRTRLRTGTENNNNVKPGESQEEEEKKRKTCVKRCHSHQLRGGDSLCRHYCSDIIRRSGVLAS